MITRTTIMILMIIIFGTLDFAETRLIIILITTTTIMILIIIIFGTGDNATSNVTR